MSRQITQPVNQVRLTNVAVVRLKTHGKRFEVAAYKNKVMNWRARIETDINEVLQVTTVFQNVSKGVIAKGEDLKEAFGTDDHAQVALMILDRGELEVSDKERAQIYENLFRDIATIVTDKCVNPETKRPYTLSMVEKALRDAHFSVNPAKGAKQQALKAVALLKASLPIERAHMTLRVSVPVPLGKELRSLLLDTMAASLDTESVWGDMYTLDATVEPGCYRALEGEVAARARGRGSVEVLALTVATDAEGAEEGAGGPDGLSSGLAQVSLSELGKELGDFEAEARGKRATAFAEATSSSSSSHSIPSSVSAPPASSSLSSSSTSSSGAVVRGGGVDAATTAASRGTGMMVRRVTQPGRRLACGACGASFESSEEHREHHRSDWHRFNLKRKMRVMEPVSLEDFDAIPPKERAKFIEDYD